MPIPISEAVEEQATLAADKARSLRTNWPRYLLSSALAGAFVGAAVVLLVMTAAGLIAGKSPVAKLVEGSVFGVALTLVVFAGAELWTGNAMVMMQGLIARKTSVVDLVAVWVASLAGNLVGSIAFAGLVNASGVLSTGAVKGKPSVFVTALTGLVKDKAALHGGQLFFRAVLCNMLVCLALWMAARTRSDAAKLVCLWWALLAFVASGFEHSVANMTLFALGAFAHVGTWSELVRNLIFTVPGNAVGGALIVGAAYAWAGQRDQATADSGQTPELDLTEPTTGTVREPALA